MFIECWQSTRHCTLPMFNSFHKTEYYNIGITIVPILQMREQKQKEAEFVAKRQQSPDFNPGILTSKSCKLINSTLYSTE